MSESTQEYTCEISTTTLDVIRPELLDAELEVGSGVDLLCGELL